MPKLQFEPVCRLAQSRCKTPKSITAQNTVSSGRVSISFKGQQQAIPGVRLPFTHLNPRTTVTVQVQGTPLQVAHVASTAYQVAG